MWAELYDEIDLDTGDAGMDAVNRDPVAVAVSDSSVAQSK